MRFFLFLLVVSWMACNSRQKGMWNAAEVSVFTRNGCTYIDSVPAEGTVFNCNASGDTLSVVHYTAGKKDGCARQWYASGQLQEERWYSNGEKNGPQILYWPNGQCKSRFTCRNDLPEGEAIEYFENGEVYKRMHYLSGHESGMQTLYAANGKIRSNYLIENGRRYGLLGTKHCGNPFSADSAVTGL